MPHRLPQLPGLGIDDDPPLSPLHQLLYKPKDVRKPQNLEPVVTLDDLRRTGVIGLRDTVHSSLAYPGLSPNFLNEPLDGVLSDQEGDDEDAACDLRSSCSGGAGGGGGGRGAGRADRQAAGRCGSPDQQAAAAASGSKGGSVGVAGVVGVGDPQRFNATAAARAALLHEKPAVVERMEKGVQACAVLRDNRHYRLFSLGVFQPAVNDVRTRSMYRVELHKHLSSTNLRAPQGDKEVRSAVQHDTVGSRIERMFNRVLRQGVEEPSAPPSAGGPLPLGAGGGAASWQQQQGMQQGTQGMQGMQQAMQSTWSSGMTGGL
ncbi:hypothetical protein Agub_g1782, partial [Astrephomene gubernaculifera]